MHPTYHTPASGVTKALKNTNGSSVNTYLLTWIGRQIEREKNVCNPQMHLSITLVAEHLNKMVPDFSCIDRTSPFTGTHKAQLSFVMHFFFLSFFLLFLLVYSFRSNIWNMTLLDVLNIMSIGFIPIVLCQSKGQVHYRFEKKPSHLRMNLPIGWDHCLKCDVIEICIDFKNKMPM